MRYILILTVIMVVACQSSEDDSHTKMPEGDHTHENNVAPTVDTTIWTDKSELFVEFPALVVNNTSRFAAHFTVLEKHKPVKEATVTASLIKDEKGIRHTVEQPASPGIFTPSLQPREAGIYQLVFDIKTPAYQDNIVIGNVRVFANTEEAINQLGNITEAGGTISFLKEQAWNIGFQTAPVEKGKIYDVINTSGNWKAAPGEIKSLTANASGIVGLAINNLTEGTTVKKGRLLMTISSKELTSDNLQTEIEKARANYEQAKTEYKRKKQLNESGIVSEAAFEKVENKYRVAKASYETLKAGYSSEGKQIRVPFDGFVKSININNGDYVDQGTGLATISFSRSRILEAHVDQSHASALQNIHNIWYQPESGKWSSINESGGSILSVGKAVEKDDPLIPVNAIINEPVAMPEGGFTEVQIAMGKPRKGLQVPETALLEDYGNYAVIVQLGGESFERRPVKIGRNNGKYVEILEGLQAGEFVVTKGAYQVKMASMSGQAPGHGHSH